MTEKRQNVSQTLGELKGTPPKTGLLEKIGLTAAEDWQRKTSRFENKTAAPLFSKNMWDKTKVG